MRPAPPRPPTRPLRSGPSAQHPQAPSPQIPDPPIQAPRLLRPSVPEPDRLCGPAAVAAAFAHRPDAVLRLFYTESRRAEAGSLCGQMARARKPYREVPAEELARIAGTPHHGGIVAVATPRRVPRLPEALPETLPEPMFRGGLLPVLDGIGNPHNLGAIARSAAFFGCGALMLSGDPRQAGLSDAAYRTSEGGLEALEMVRAEDMPAALRRLAPYCLTVAAVARGGVAPEALPRGRPFALVLGNEEHGLPEATAAACAARVTLPGSGAVESLNVSVAAAVLIHALRGGAGAGG